MRCIIVGLIMLVLGACGQPAATSPADSVADTALSGELIVFAAASLTEAFTALGRQFEADNPDTTVVFNFAGSQQLAQQLAQGAPADVFASANPRRMEVAVEAGRIIGGTQQIFVRNCLVAITPADNPGAVNTLQDLTKPDLKIVLAAEDTPIGGYSRDYLDKATTDPDFGSEYHDAVLANVVSYEETVKAVLTKVALGEADAGIVYSSDVTPDQVDQVVRIDIPDELNTIATYPIAIVEDTSQPESAQAFLDYVLSANGQAVLGAYGFIPVE
ncbi:MAG: molybdate ABC transporter substrate-binding protein [Chloroflexaceae bacterium]